MAGRRRKTQLYGNDLECKWRVGVYCRLSSDDGDNAESDSIINQRTIISNYLKSEDNLNIIDYYTDDGFSGTSFNRPGFKRLFSDITTGKVNTIIVKDLSRFGRNYLEVGNYLEHIFPMYNIRFIAINDFIDSYKDPKSMNSAIVPFKNLLNDEYARDISNKVRSVLFAKSKNGEFVGGTAPYGYMKDPKDIHHLIINEQEAKNVRMVYEMALSGDGLLKIVQYLNNNRILCRKELQRRNRRNIDVNSEDEELVYKWSKSTIGNMLTNEMYIGNLVFNRSGTKNYKDHKQRPKPKSEWIIVQGTHEGIVSKEEFEQVGKLIAGRRSKKTKTSMESIFSWKIKCADCGHAMCKMDDYRGGRVSSNFYCRNYKTQSNTCSPHKIRTTDLTNAVLKIVQFQIDLILDLDKVANSKTGTIKKDNIEKAYNNKLNKLNDDIAKSKRLKKEAYENWKFGNITKEKYFELAKSCDDKITALEKEIEISREQYSNNSKTFKKDNYWIEHYKRNKNLKMLSREVIDELIDTIYVHSDGDVTIKFKYQDEFEKMMKLVGKGSEIAV